MKIWQPLFFFQISSLFYPYIPHTFARPERVSFLSMQDEQLEGGEGGLGLCCVGININI